MEMATRDDLGMTSWMGDMFPQDSREVMLGQADSPYFADSPHSLDDMRVRPLDMDGFLMLTDDYDHYYDDPAAKYMTSAATQTPGQPTRKIKPIKHPGLVLKTPIAYQKDTDLSVIPIQKDGMAVCEKCGAIGVKHAFYTKSRRFCSQSCAREYNDWEKGFPIGKQSPSLSLDTPMLELHANKKLIKLENFSMKRMKCEPEPMLPQEIFALDSLGELTSSETSPGQTNKLIDMPYSYEWQEALNEENFNAAPVTCFKHALGVHAWKDVNIGMKVEVENTDCDDYSELLLSDSFWVASVLRVSGYCALLRYIGFAENDEKDFWVNICSPRVHPVGWCAMRGKPLIPPKTIEYKYTDWKGFLSKNLHGAQTLPSNFINKVHASIESRFRTNMTVEVVDKNRISQVKVATIHVIVGKRLQVRYYDCDPDDNGFVCHEDSPLLHPVGWAKRVGATIDAPPDYMLRCNTGKWNEDDATADYFLDYEYARFSMPDSKLDVGMKLEAIDPLNLSSICVATVMQVLLENFVMIRIDSYDEDATHSDWFCYHASSPCIFPAGFCNVNVIALTPPKGYNADLFNWPDYLEETGLTTAPLAIFHREIPKHGFKVGMRLEAADLMDPRLVCVGTISRVVGRLLKVHFDGWEDEYDQWLDCESPDIYPVGWCHIVRHKLEGPRPKPGTIPGKQAARGVKRKLRRRGFKKGPLNRTLKSSPTSPGSSRLESETPEPATATEQASKPTSPHCSSTALEPEMGQEPAGPDQSLPVSTDPNLLPGMPRERAATSYINSMGASGKVIPRLVDATGTTEAGELVPNEWNVYDVAQFLRVNDCATYCDSFSKRKIDGKTLLNLSKDQIIDLTGMKVGPSLKIFDLIQQLKIKVNPSVERQKAFKKIIS